MLIYALSSDVLSRWNKPLKPFATWLHFNCAWDGREVRIITRLVKNGCRFLFVTGAEYEEIRDMVDCVAIAETNDSVLTRFGSRIDKEVAFDFLMTNCPGEAWELRTIGALDKNSDAEVDTLLRMMGAVEEAFGHLALGNYSIR